MFQLSSMTSVKVV